MEDDSYTDDDIRRLQEELLQSDARLNEVGGPSAHKAEDIMKQVSDREAGKHTFTKTTDDRSIFIQNLPKGENGYTTTHEDLSNFFAECGQILTLTLLSDRKTQQFKGAAYIEFATFEGIGRALDTKQNAMFHGNALKVEKKRSLYRPPTGPGGRGRGGAMGHTMPGAAGGADAMAAMMAMMMAAAGKMMQQNNGGGGRGGGGFGGGSMGGGRGYGRGRGGRGGGGYGGGYGNNNNAAAFGSADAAATPFGAPAGGASSAAPAAPASGSVFANPSTPSPFGNPTGNGFGFGGGNNTPFQ